MSSESEPIHPLARKPEVEPDYTPPPPVSREERLKRLQRTWGIWALIIVNTAVFVLGGISTDSILQRAYEGGLNPFFVLNQGEYLRLFTAMFLHGNVIHLAFNMLALNSVGSWVEVMFGHRKFWVIYLLSGLGGSVLATAMAAPNTISVGASGALFGLIGALIVFFQQHGKHLNQNMRLVRRSLITSAAMTLAVGLIPGSIIDNWGHLGGFLIGAALGYGFAPRYHFEKQIDPETGQEKITATDTNIKWRWQYAAMITVVLLSALMASRLLRTF